MTTARPGVDGVQAAPGAAPPTPPAAVTAAPSPGDEPEAQEPGSRRLGGRPAGPLVALSLVTLVDQVDVSILRGVLPLIQDDFGVPDWQLGALGFAFVFVNALAAIPAGWVADRVRRTRLIGYTLLSWSALSLLSALSRSYGQLFVARASLGFGQAVDDPASTSLLADTYPAEVRGRVFSVQQVMTFVGLGLGIGLGGLVGGAFGWQWAFALVGMPGSLVALAVFRLREPRRGEADGIDLPEPPRVPLRELSRGAWSELRADLRVIFAIRTMRYILVGVSAMLFTVAGVGYWLATYHERYSGLTEEQAAGSAALVLGVAGILGTIWGGRVTDRVYGASPAGRITAASSAVIVCTVVFSGSLVVPWIPLRFAMQLVGVLAAASAAPGIRASMMDVAPAHARGVSTSAFALVSTVLGTALAPVLVGAISDLTGSLAIAFFAVMPPVVAGTLVFRRATHTIVDDAAAILTAMAAASPIPDGEHDDGIGISF